MKKPLERSGMKNEICLYVVVVTNTGKIARKPNGKDLCIYDNYSRARNHGLVGWRKEHCKVMKLSNLSEV